MSEHEFSPFSKAALVRAADSFFDLSSADTLHGL
jgi:hypothetical protein